MQPPLIRTRLRRRNEIPIHQRIRIKWTRTRVKYTSRWRG
jgi:hypothetical protein